MSKNVNLLAVTLVFAALGIALALINAREQDHFSGAPVSEPDTETTANPDRQHIAPVDDRTAPVKTLIATVNRDDDGRATGQWSEDEIDFVNRKYKYLFSDMSVDAATRQALPRLLLEREDVAAAIRSAANRNSDTSRLEERLQAIDQRIARLLDPAGYERFAMLKDSDHEQQHLYDYSGGVRQLTPLKEEQERAVLFAKLRHKQWYETALREAGFDRDHAMPARQARAREAAVQALQTYKDNFLRDIKQFLSPRQYELLRNYETTEFNKRLKQIRNPD